MGKVTFLSSRDNSQEQRGYASVFWRQVDLRWVGSKGQWESAIGVKETVSDFSASIQPLFLKISVELVSVRKEEGLDRGCCLTKKLHIHSF